MGLFSWLFGNKEAASEHQPQRLSTKEKLERAQTIAIGSDLTSKLGRR